MATHKINKTIIGFILISIVLVNSGCPKPCVEANYAFAVNSQILPNKDSVQVGDTIFLISTFSTNLFDQITGKTVDYSGSSGIESTLSVSKVLAGDSIGTDAVFDFNYFALNGRIFNDRSIPSPDRVQQLTYGELNGNYNLKIAIIPKVKGNYVLGLGDGLSNGRNKTNECENAAFSISFNDIDQHFYLIYEWVPNIMLNDYGKLRVYYFKVY